MPNPNNKTPLPEEEKNNHIPSEGREDKPEFDRDEGRNIWLIILKYAITYAVALGIFFLTLTLRNFFTDKLTPANYYRYLSDAFTIPGATFICLALLVFVSKKGAFTGLMYALRHVGRMLLPFLIKNDLSYAEYLEARENRKGLSIILCFFIVGGTFLIGALVCIILFYQVYGN